MIETEVSKVFGVAACHFEFLTFIQASQLQNPQSICKAVLLLIPPPSPPAELRQDAEINIFLVKGLSVTSWACLLLMEQKGK